MADFEELSFSYLGLLSNAHHDGTTQQIDDCCGNYETDNATFLRKSQALHQCRVKEDEAWKKSQVDPVVKQLQAADKQQDNYISCFHSIVTGYATLPDSEAQKALHCQPSRFSRTSSFPSTTATVPRLTKSYRWGRTCSPCKNF